LNLFETYETSQKVPLKFNDLVVTSMLRGKKVMHLFDDPEFEYLPGETVLIPSNVEMKIDFPEATKNNPTQCLALAIDQMKIQETLGFLNERYPKEGKGNFWKLDHENYFFYNNVELSTTINKLIKECMSTSITKDALADLSLQELLIRIIQSQNVRAIETNTIIDINNPIVPIMEFIRSNIRENFNLKELVLMIFNSIVKKINLPVTKGLFFFIWKFILLLFVPLTLNRLLRIYQYLRS